jgi:hypothetical protein
MAVWYVGTSGRRRSTAELPRPRVWLRGAVIQQARDEVTTGCWDDSGREREAKSLICSKALFVLQLE